MRFDPQSFFIGQMDSLSILLRGALPTYLLMDKVGPARGSLYPARRRTSLGRSSVREPFSRPLGLPARDLDGRALRLGPTLHAEHRPDMTSNK